MQRWTFHQGFLTSTSIEYSHIHKTKKPKLNQETCNYNRTNFLLIYIVNNSSKHQRIKQKHQRIRSTKSMLKPGQYVIQKISSEWRQPLGQTTPPITPLLIWKLITIRVSYFIGIPSFHPRTKLDGNLYSIQHGRHCQKQYHNR